jgi:tRNA(fMet)-specific endonuclease VapC
VRYLLDTNVFIAAMRGQSAVKERLSRTPLDEVVLSPVVLAELLLGVEKSAHREANARRVASVVHQLAMVAIDADTSSQYALLRAALERQGRLIGANDLWIAAQCMALGLVLVTDNGSEFARIDGLVTENWLRQDVPGS